MLSITEEQDKCPLYSLYVNEITLIYKLLKNKINCNMTKDTNIKFNNKIEHITYNFVDDSTSIISFKNADEIKIYLTKYFNLIQSFYTINKL